MQVVPNNDPNLSPTAAPPPPLQLAQPAGSDFWDVGEGSLIGAQMPQDAEFSELVEVRTTSPSKARPVLIILLVLVIAGAGWGAYETFVNERNPLDTLTALLHGGEEATGEDAGLEQPRPKKAKKTKDAPVAKAKKPAKAVEGNPYWALPNRILGPKREVGRMWSAEEEETLRAGLNHRYTYQRYKTVQDIRKQRYRGSDALLWDAMQDKKFWTRMWAAVGLAEFNVEVSLQSLEGAMAGARSELVADFFERFIRKPNAAQLFVLRQAVRLLDEKGRLIVLQAIWRSKDDLRDLYMAAATQDPGRRVQRWVKQALLERPIDPDRYNELLEVVEGKADGSYLVAQARAGDQSDGKAPTKPGGDVKGHTGITTQEDLDKELAAFDDTGDVEFYEKDAKPPTDEPDPDTFEYEE